MTCKRVLIFGWAKSVHVRRWAQGLSGRGLQVKVVSLGHEQVPGVETVNVAELSKIAYIIRSGKAVKEARQFDPDIVNVHYASGFGIWMMRAKIRPSVVSVWGSDVTALPANPLLKNIVKRTLVKADAITATSKDLKQSVLNIDPAFAAKTSVIPFGVDIPEIVTEPPPLPPLRLCYLKKHEMIYGPDVLLRAIVRVKEKMPDVKLSMASFGSLTEMLRKMIVDLGLEKNVEITGWLDYDSVHDFILKHHIVVMPSLREAFGVAALDAAAAGRPVVATNVGGIPEAVVHGKTGLLVPAGDDAKLAEAILELAGDPKKLAAMGRAGYEFVRQEYSWEKSLDKMIDLYERLVHEKKKHT